MNLWSRLPGTRAWKHRRAGGICAETTARIQELVDGELPSTQLLAHLDDCPPCAVEAESVRELKRAIGRVGSDVDGDVVARLRDWATRLPDDPAP